MSKMLKTSNTVYIKAMSKVSKIDQIHLRAVMLCMSKTSKILKQAITDYIELILFHVEDVEDVYNVYELQCRF